MFWIRIRMYPHHFGNLDLPLDPHQSNKLDPEPDLDPHLFEDDKPKCMEY
jgi:hypothetical protein